MDSHLQVINDGEITVDLKRAYQTRILHTAGQYGSLLNNGIIRVKTGGRIMVLGSLAGTRMINNGTIEVVSLATFLENKVSYHYQFAPLATAMYEHFLPNDLPTCPTVNRGTINVHLLGTEASGPNAVARSAKFDLSDMHLELIPSDGVSDAPIRPRDLVYQIETSKEAGETCEVYEANLDR